MNDFFYKKVEAYKKAKAFVVYVYTLLNKFPDTERYSLCDQIRRAAISIPSNIAEGLGRMSIRERLRSIEIAYGSLTEVTCQLDIAQSLEYITPEELNKIETLSDELARIMSGLRKALIEKMNNNKGDESE